MFQRNQCEGNKIKRIWWFRCNVGWGGGCPLIIWIQIFFMTPVYMYSSILEIKKKNQHFFCFAVCRIGRVLVGVCSLAPVFCHTALNWWWSVEKWITILYKQLLIPSVNLLFIRSLQLPPNKNIFMITLKSSYITSNFWVHTSKNQHAWKIERLNFFYAKLTVWKISFLHLIQRPKHILFM